MKCKCILTLCSYINDLVGERDITLNKDIIYNVKYDSIKEMYKLYLDNIFKDIVNLDNEIFHKHFQIIDDIKDRNFK